MKTLKLFQTTILLIFGIITIAISSAVLFDWFDIREKQGNYVEFVVIANFLCGFLYLGSVLSNLNGNVKWSARLLGFATLLLVLTFIAFLLYINKGNAYELKTVEALTMRTVLTALMAVISVFILKRQ